MFRLARGVLACVCCFWLLPTGLRAHQSTNSYLLISVTGGELLWQWDVSVGDLAHVLPLQTNAQGVVSAEELVRQQNAIVQYALSHLQARADGEPCSLEFASDQLGIRENGTYARIELVSRWPTNATRLELSYRALFEADPTHRGLLRLEWNGATRTGVFTATTPTQTFTAGASTGSQQFVTFAREGIRHIWTGLDHILFLLVLLFPAVVRRGAASWQPVDAFRPAFLQIVKVVTAFTVAHSITLTLAVLGIVRPPSRLIESTIAVSVLIAAANNLRPLLLGNSWMLAFGFGLIHGFGFANALAEMELPRTRLALTLLAFNLGVEIGQLAIVSVFLPVAFRLRASWFYRKLVLQAGSLAVCLVAVTWIVERLFAIKVLPF